MHTILPRTGPVGGALVNPTPDAPARPELVQALLEVLEQGETLLAGLADDHYTTPVPVAFHATIGGHYRHCLDHVRSLLEAAGAGPLDYDRRERGTPVETSRHAALAVTRELWAGCAALPSACLNRPLPVTCKTSYATTGSQTADSTVGREAMYAVAHAVHHYALIRIMAGLLGVNLSADFGVAPSTLRHRTAGTAGGAGVLAA